MGEGVSVPLTYSSRCWGCCAHNGAVSYRPVPPCAALCRPLGCSFIEKPELVEIMSYLVGTHVEMKQINEIVDRIACHADLQQDTDGPLLTPPAFPSSCARRTRGHGRSAPSASVLLCFFSGCVCRLVALDDCGLSSLMVAARYDYSTTAEPIVC